MEGKAEQALKKLLKDQYGYKSTRERDAIQEANQPVQ
jgi:hypothetical protein